MSPPMSAPWWWLSCVLLAGYGLGLARRGGVVLRDNAYEGVVVAVAEDVAEHPNIVPNLKRMFQEGSRVLDVATRGRAHFGQVTLLLPPSWTTRPEYKRVPGDVTLSSSSAVRVGAPYPQHGHAPYTVQMGGCGEEGEAIHLTPHYAINMYGPLQQEYGPPGKVLVHEWAHYRWGVFDEYVTHPSKATPPFYIDRQGKVRVSGCTGGLRGWLGTAGGVEGGCHADVTGLPDARCHFFPAEEGGGGQNGSLMALYYLDTVTRFCDGEEVPHNALAPTPHNLMCGGRPVWEVIAEHPDFRGGANPPRNKTRTAEKTIKEKRGGRGGGGGGGRDDDNDQEDTKKGDMKKKTEEEEEEKKEKGKNKRIKRENNEEEQEEEEEEEEETDNETEVIFEVIQLEKEEGEEEEEENGRKDTKEDGKEGDEADKQDEGDEINKKNIESNTATEPEEEEEGEGGGGGGEKKEEEEEEEEEEEIKYAPRFVLLLDLSGSMDAYMSYLTQALRSFVRFLVPEGSKMAVLSFANTTHHHLPWTRVGRERGPLLARLPTTHHPQGYTAIGRAMEDTLKLVEREGVRSEGLQVVLVTDGEETVFPLVSEVLPKFKARGMVLNTVSFGRYATDSLELWAQETGGQSFCHNIGFHGQQTDLASLLYSAITTPDTRAHLQLQVHGATHWVMGEASWGAGRRGKRGVREEVEEEEKRRRRRRRLAEGEVLLDSSLGRHTQFIFTVIRAHAHPHRLAVGVVLVAPDGKEYRARVTKEEEEEEKEKKEEEEEEEVKIFQDSSSFAFIFRSAKPGKWSYTLTNGLAHSREEVQVLVTSRPAPATPTPPARVEVGVSATSVTFPDPVVVWARVTQGRSAVLEANVTAIVSLPTERAPVSLPLMDHGIGADHQAGDGVYAAYFTQFSGDGRYGLSVYVTTTNTTTRTQEYQSSPSPSSSSPSTFSYSSTIPPSSSSSSLSSASASSSSTFTSTSSSIHIPSPSSLSVSSNFSTSSFPSSLSSSSSSSSFPSTSLTFTSSSTSSSTTISTNTTTTTSSSSSSSSSFSSSSSSSLTSALLTTSSTSSSTTTSTNTTTTSSSSSFFPTSPTPAQAKGTSAVRRLPPLTGPLPLPKINFPPSDLKPPREVTAPPTQGNGRATGERIEPFSRYSSGGVFKVTNYQPGDLQPPGRVLDLSVTRVDLFEVTVTLAWTSPGDDLYTGTASALELSYHPTSRPHVTSPGRQVNQSHLTSGDLTPLPAGAMHTVTLKVPGGSVEGVEGRPYFFWVRAGDEVGNWGGMSNTATAVFPLQANVLKVKKQEVAKAVNGLVVLVTLGAVILLLASFTAYIKYLHARRRKRREHPLMEGGTLGREGGAGGGGGGSRHYHNYSWEGGR